MTFPGETTSTTNAGGGISRVIVDRVAPCKAAASSSVNTTRSGMLAVCWHPSSLNDFSSPSNFAKPARLRGDDSVPYLPDVKHSNVVFQYLSGVLLHLYRKILILPALVCLPKEGEVNLWLLSWGDRDIHKIKGDRSSGAISFLNSLPVVSRPP